MNSLSNKRFEKRFMIIVIPLAISFPLLTLVIHNYLESLIEFNNILRNSLAIHTIIELSSVLVSIFIATLGWMTFRFKMSKKRLLYSSLFLAIGLFDFLHTFYIQGMPFLFIEGTIAKTGWFWMVARLTESLGILTIILMTDRIILKKCRSIYFAMSLTYVTALSTIIFTWGEQLPALFTEDTITTLKIILGYGLGVIHLLALFIIGYQTKKQNNNENISFILPIIFLLVSELLFTMYNTFDDFEFLLGHLYKLLGYSFLLRELYKTAIEEPYLKKQLVEKDKCTSDQQMRWMIERIPGGFVAVNKDGNITIANPTAKRILSDTLGVEEVVGINIKQFLTTKTGIDNENCPLLKSIEEIKPYMKKKIKTGHHVFQADASPIFNPITQELHGGVCYFFDITDEEKENKERNELFRHYLYKSKNLQRLIDSIPMALIALDKDGRVIAANEQLLNFFSIENEVSDVIGKDFKDTFHRHGHIHNEDFPIIKALKGEEIDNFYFSIEDRKFLSSAYPIYCEEEKTIIGSIALYQNVTELEVLRNEMNNMERLSIVGKMAASITHEIRNPMATVRGFIQLLQERNNESESQKIYQVILDEIDRANEIISDFLALSRTRIIEKKESDLNKIVLEIEPILTAETNLNGQYIALDLEPNLPLLHLNENEIKQLLINLSRNAMEAMGKAGTLTIKTIKTEYGIELQIKDTGSGIDEVHLNKIYEPFFTTKERGTGLGLSVCMSIAEKHNGKLNVISEKGKGTVFILSLFLNHTRNLH